MLPVLGSPILQTLVAAQKSPGKHSLEQELGFWQIFEPPGMVSLQTGSDGEDSQSEFVEQITKILE